MRGFAWPDLECGPVVRLQLAEDLGHVLSSERPVFHRLLSLFQLSAIRCANPYWKRASKTSASCAV